MEQRPLRLGDIVDDYCPRERRLTNHAVVAIVEQTIKQTRCTTCEHEHVYKQAKEPRRRKKDDTSALYSQVLSGLQKPAGQSFPQEQEADRVDDSPNDAPAAEPVIAEIPVPVAAAPAPVAVAHAAPLAVAVPPVVEAPAVADEDEDEGPNGNFEGAGGDGDEPWPTHRRLIRAQLPRTGNEPPPARPLPEFTVRQPGARSQRPWGRGGQGGGAMNGNGNHAHGRGGQGQGQGQGGGGSRPGRGRGFAPPRPDGRGGQGHGGGRPGGGRGRRSR